MLKINNNLIEKYKDKLENPDFEQNIYSRTAIGIYKKWNDSIKLMKWLACYDMSYYEDIKNYDLMGFISKNVNEMYKWNGWILRRSKRSPI